MLIVPVIHWFKAKILAQIFLKEVFLVEGTAPEVLFYDNNCNLARSVKGKGDKFWEKMGLPVDVFHFECKHKQSDLYCQSHCNPYNFPELVEGKKWVFNSSVAEQTNAWFGGYHSICREMLVDRYNFFLDEMVMRKNRLMIEKLVLDNALPTYAQYL